MLTGRQTGAWCTGGSSGQMPRLLDSACYGNREYNALVEGTAGEVAKLKEVQQTAMAEQMKLDEASLQRLHAEQAAAKVGGDSLHSCAQVLWMC